MKTMTDFIMEQEVAPQVVEESFNESELVSKFMALQAASANVSCVLEYATISEFCESNEINMPESLVQEGFKDFLDKVLEGIVNLFQKLADWFKSLIKGATATFSKAKIQEMIAKLNGVKNDDLSSEAAEKVVYIHYAYQLLIDSFVTFKDIYLNAAELCDKNKATSFNYDGMIDTLDNFVTFTKTLAKDKIFKANGELIDELGTSKTFKGNPINDPKKVSDLIAVLSEINRTNFAKTGQQLIKDIDSAEHTFEEFKTTEKVTEKDENGNDVTSTKETKISAGQAREIKSKFQTIANNIASAYDKITKKFVNIADEATKDIEIGDKKTFAKDLEKAKKESGKNTAEDLKR